MPMIDVARMDLLLHSAYGVLRSLEGEQFHLTYRHRGPIPHQSIPFVIVRALYPLPLTISCKFRLSFHTRCRGLVGRLYFFTT